MTYKPQTTVLIEQLQINNNNDWDAILTEILLILMPANTVTWKTWFHENEIEIPMSVDDIQQLCCELIDKNWFQIGQYFEFLSDPPEIDDYDEDGRRTG